MNTRSAAYDTVHGLYLKHICGMSAGDAYSTYTGEMDLHRFVESCPVPSTSDLEMHRECWAEVRSMFAEAWSRFERGNF